MIPRCCCFRRNYPKTSLRLLNAKLSALVVVVGQDAFFVVSSDILPEHFQLSLPVLHRSTPCRLVLREASSLRWCNINENNKRLATRKSFYSNIHNLTTTVAVCPLALQTEQLKLIINIYYIIPLFKSERPRSEYLLN